MFVLVGSLRPIELGICVPTTYGYPNRPDCPDGSRRPANRFFFDTLEHPRALQGTWVHSTPLRDPSGSSGVWRCVCGKAEVILKGATLADGRPIAVYQTGWPDLHVHASTYSSARTRARIQSQGAGSVWAESSFGRMFHVTGPESTVAKAELQGVPMAFSSRGTSFQ